MSVRVLVTGATGILGPWVATTAQSLGSVVTTARSGGDIQADLRSPEAARQLIRAVMPEVVIHTAAHTDVDDCEANPHQADSLNHVAVAHLSAALPKATHLVLVSTDQVYPDAPGPHAEGHEGPVNAYGRSKLAGERAALANHANTATVRTNLFGPSRTEGRCTLSDTLATRMRTGDPCPLFTDVLFSPLHLATLSRLLVDVARIGLTGTYNAGSREGASKHDFGVMLARHLGLPLDSAFPVSSDSIAGRAHRPHDLRLDVRRIEDALGRVMPSLAEEVRLL